MESRHITRQDYHPPAFNPQSSPWPRSQGQQSATAPQPKQPTGQPHHSALDYLRTPAAYTPTPGYQSPYAPTSPPPPIPNIHQQVISPKMSTSAGPGVPNRLPHGTNHPASRSNWPPQHSAYYGPSYSSFSSPGQPDQSRQLPEPLSPDRGNQGHASSPATPTEQSSAPKEQGNHSLPELTPIEQAILDHIAVWNAAHPREPAIQHLGPGLNKPFGNPSHEASPPLNNQTANQPNASLQTTTDPQAHLPAEQNLERLRSLPRPQTYYEFTGGTLPNAHPLESGICSNMDFKTKTFIDAHGAPFTGTTSGKYRYMRPESRAQELAIMHATYQTIVDFEMYIGSSPRQKLPTWESYEVQYRLIQWELMGRWVGPPELMPKLR